MAKFLTGNSLNEKIYDIIFNAENYLLIVSPHIKLDKYFKTLFENHLNNYKVRLEIVFGKNESDAGKSLNKDDLDFFTRFPNVSIIYIPKLHGKYYCNEREGMITSINFYDYSFKNNIEFGVYTEVSILDKITDTIDKQAWQYCSNLTEESEVIFVKRPIIQSKLFGENYMGSKILFDVTSNLLANKKFESKKISDFDNTIDFEESKKGSRPTRESLEPSRESQNKNTSYQNNLPQQGYCIRTGIPIPFDIQKPMCLEAYKNWAKYGNPDFKEKYCHKTGRISYGNTSMRNPIL